MRPRCHRETRPPDQMPRNLPRLIRGLVAVLFFVRLFDGAAEGAPKLAHPLPKALAQFRQPLRPEQQQRRNQDQDDLLWT